MTRHALSLLVLPLLAACAAPGTVPARPDQSGDACGASGYQSLIGRPLAAVTLPAGLDLRIINPGDAVTMDFRDTRLNFELDADGNVAVVRCG